MGTNTLFAALAVAAAACSGDSLGQVFGDIRACASAEDLSCEPPIDLLAFKSAQTHATSVALRNTGTGILRVAGAEVLAGAGLAIDDVPALIRPSTSQPLLLSLTPDSGPGVGTIAVDSDDPDTPRFEFDVRWEGIEPLLVFCPTPGLTTTPAGCADDLTVTLTDLRPGEVLDVTVLARNAGTSPVDLDDAAISDQASVAGELSVLTSVAGGVMNAGAESRVVVRYAPSDGEPDQFDVALVPVDTALPGATLRVETSLPSNQPPSAVAVEWMTTSSTATVVAGTGVWLDSAGSSDPEGDPLQFSWGVAGAPLGSAADVDHPNGTLTRFAPDVMGPYAVQLQVRDSLGATGFATVNITAEPRFGLTVIASWGTNAGDVDLHVYPEGGSLFGATDCFFDQPVIDWGVAADPIDDGELVADDDSPDGTERIRVARPTPGRYVIVANYFDSRGGRQADVDVDILTDDETVTLRTVAGTLNADCDTWEVGTLDWPAGTVTLNVMPNTSNCFGGP